MYLCTTERFAENDRYCKISYSPAKQPTASKGTNRPTWTGYVGTDEPSRYCINIRGLSIYEILWSPYGMVDMSFVLRQRAGVHTGLKKYASKFYEQIGDMEDGNIGGCAGEWSWRCQWGMAVKTVSMCTYVLGLSLSIEILVYKGHYWWLPFYSFQKFK